MLAFNMSCLASYVTFVNVAFVINHIPARLFSDYSRDGYYSRKYGTTCTRDCSSYEDFTISVTTLELLLVITSLATMTLPLNYPYLLAKRLPPAADLSSLNIDSMELPFIGRGMVK